MTHHTFKGLSQPEIEEALKAECYKHEMLDYQHELTDEEVEQKKNDLSLSMISKDEMEEELKQIKEEYKEKMKPINENIAELLSQIKTGYSSLHGSVYMCDDQANGDMLYYSKFGELVHKRDLLPEERQLKFVEHSIPE